MHAQKIVTIKFQVCVSTQLVMCFREKKKKKRKLEGGRVGCHCEGNIHKQGFVKYG